MHKSFGSHFFRTSNEIQLGLDAFDKSRFFMNFKNHIWNYRNRLVLKGKIEEEIPELSKLEFYEHFSAISFVLSYAEDNTSGLLNR